MTDDRMQRSLQVESCEVDIRVANRKDLHTLEELIRESFSEIGREHYSIRQVHRVVSKLGRIDTSLLDDGTLFVATVTGRIVGCGGWSGRRNLMSHADGINPNGDMIFAHKDAAVLRSFFVQPAFSRQGIATRLFQKCRAEAESNGYLRLEVLAAASARAAAKSFGFREQSEVQLHFDDGSHIVSHRMSMRI